MSYYSKDVKFFDLGLISGSGDPMRTALRHGYYEADFNDDGQIKYTMSDVAEAQAASADRGVSSEIKINDYIDFRTKFVNTKGSIGAAALDYARETLVPVIRYPVRLYGDNETIYSDLHWKAYLIGGVYGDQEYDGVYSTSEYTDHIFAYHLPYKPSTVKEANPVRSELYNVSKITYDYNYYYDKYEKSTGLKNNILEIPNAYILQMFSHADMLYFDNSTPERDAVRAGMGAVSTEDVSKFANSLYGTSVVNYVTREDKFDYNLYNNFFVTQDDIELASVRGVEQKWTFSTPLTKKYFQYYYPLFENESRTTQVTNEKFKNLIFDHKVLSQEFTELYNNRNALPFYSKIALPAAGTGFITDALQKYDMSGKFLLMLKKAFVDNSLNVKPTEVDFKVQEIGHLNPSLETSKIYDTKVRLLPVIDFFTEMRTDYLCDSDDFYCIGNPKEISRQSLYDKTGDYRHFNTIGATRTLSDIVQFTESDEYLESIKDPYGNACRQIKQHETIAYRVEKIGGEPIGDSNTQTVLQNFFISNSEDLKNELIDSQVKYGELYTYNIYAYVAVKGYRYQTSDLRITKTIGDLTRPEDTETIRCLEFYDPYTNKRRNRLVLENTFVERDLDNRLATTAQLASANYKYLADFHVSVQPSIMLIEVPVATNIVRVLDHPVNGPFVVPYQITDQSQRVGFDIQYKAFEELKYPTVISPREEKLKQDYLESNSLYENELIKKMPVSTARYVEIFRTKEKPMSYANFENKKIFTKDLAHDKIYQPVDENGLPINVSNLWWSVPENLTYTSCVYNDILETNTKYYYAMRFLNQRGDPGHFSPIYVVELINDGGYVYPKFDIIHEYELSVDKDINPIKNLKKLLNIVPNFQHVIFDDSLVDYDKSAFSQKDKLSVGLKSTSTSDGAVHPDSLWGKTFKFRITSKKTGKKIDLNISYTLSR